MPKWREDPSKVRPMLASLEEPPIAKHGLVYEPKYDGIRALIDIRPAGGGRDPAVAIYSRNGNDKTRQFPAIAAALARAAKTLTAPVLLDGEIAATTPAGVPLGFERIQPRIHLTSDADIARAERAQPTALLLFDILRDGDEDLRGQPFATRRLALQARIRVPKALQKLVRLSDISADDGRPMLERARREGWEGLIVKDGQSLYHSGRRTPAWRKMKLLAEQELVIVGWTDPRETRLHFGALLLGYYEHGQLTFAGSVGTGFDTAELNRLAELMAPLATTKSPVVDPKRAPRLAHWITPKLVAEVRFTEWTSDGLLRQPVYLGTRDDKAAKDVTREVPRAAAAEGATTMAKRIKPATKKAAAGATIKKTVATSPVRPRTAAGAVRTLSEQLSALEESRKDGEIALPNGDRLRVTNLAKLFWPKLGITKGELLKYYADIAPLVLEAVNDRPLVMERSPNGVDKPFFYQQRHPEAVPPGVRREELPADVEPIDEADGRSERLIGGSLTTLLYMTQLGAISQDPWFSRVADPMHADYAAIDLDPGDGTTFATVLDVARWIKEELDRLDIPAVPKTSGASGLHIYVPLPKGTTYETGQLLCQVVATMISTRHPKAATVERMVKRRARGTVYVDYLQNILGKTLATAYSARASDYAGVSTPLTWGEVEEGIDPRDFTIRTAPARFKKTGDLWARVRTGKKVNIKAVIRAMK